MMNYKTLFILGFPIFFIMNYHLLSGETFPVFSASQYNIRVPKDMIGYNPDPENETGDFAVYTIQGIIFATNSEGNIDDTTGNQQSDLLDTPFASLCQLLKSYKSGQISEVLGVHTAESQAEINAIFADSSTQQNYQTFMASISNISVKLGFFFNDGFYAIVSLNINSGETPLLPYFLKQVDNKWLVSTLNDTSKMTSNIAVFLKNNNPADLIVP